MTARRSRPGSSSCRSSLALYGFSQTQAKTDDGFFLGFPSVLERRRLLSLRVSGGSRQWEIAIALILTCVVLTFVPTRYIYATQGGPFAKTMTAGAVIWTALVLWVLMAEPREAKTLGAVSLIYPLLYLALSAVVSRRARQLESASSKAAVPDIDDGSLNFSELHDPHSFLLRSSTSLRAGHDQKFPRRPTPDRRSGYRMGAGAAVCATTAHRTA